jgi:hypothetical protein
MNEDVPSSGAGPEPAVAGPADDGQEESRRPPIPIGGTATTSTAPSPSPSQSAVSQSVSESGDQAPDRQAVGRGWWPFTILLLAVAVLLSVLVALATGFSDAHRAAAALVALLDVAALATLAHVTLLGYQTGILNAAGANPDASTLAFRRRGLKAAVIGEDGRASTSKAQVVIWTGAVVWALIYLLLLARAFPSGNVFTAAVGNNWRPEYLALLGFPVAAAATAKAAVVSSNSGLGPQPSGDPDNVAGKLQAPRVYMRDPIPDNKRMQGVVNGLAELITSDDGSVAWADLQYVTFTLITLVYFAVQLLTQPGNGLPPVPAALLTLMGVSAGAYTANKIVDTKGTVPDSAAPAAQGA